MIILAARYMGMNEGQSRAASSKLKLNIKMSRNEFQYGPAISVMADILGLIHSFDVKFDLK